MHQKVTGPVRALTAEFIGTFSLIFIGAGAATALGRTSAPALMPHPEGYAASYPAVANKFALDLPGQAATFRWRRLNQI